jgi:hypothetical protein
MPACLDCPGGRKASALKLFNDDSELSVIMKCLRAGVGLTGLVGWDWRRLGAGGGGRGWAGLYKDVI